MQDGVHLSPLQKVIKSSFVFYCLAVFDVLDFRAFSYSSVDQPLELFHRFEKLRLENLPPESSEIYQLLERLKKGREEVNRLDQLHLHRFLSLEEKEIQRSADRRVELFSQEKKMMIALVNLCRRYVHQHSAPKPLKN